MFLENNKAIFGDNIFFEECAYKQTFSQVHCGHFKSSQKFVNTEWRVN